MRRRTAVVVGGAVVLVLAGLAASGTKTQDQKATAAPTAAAATAAMSAAASQVAAVASALASAEPTVTATLPPTAVPTPEPTAAFEPIELTGSGDKLARFDKPSDQAAIVVVSYSGGGNFIVTNLDANGNQIDLLVNTIGSYKGTVLIDARSGEESAALQIEASGSWKCTIKPVAAAPTWSGAGTLSRKGDDVIHITGEITGLTGAAIQHNGDSNFIVESYGLNGIDLLVNEIGEYSGEVALPADTFLLEVHADGPWTVTLQR